MRAGLIKVTHFGQKCMVEKDPLKMALVPISGDGFHQGILVHERYVPDGFKHKKVSLRGRVRGRTLYCLLDEPISYQGQNYSILNFKGAGADYEGEELLIRSNHTHSGGQMFPRESQTHSPWGGITLRSAQREAKFRLFFEHGIVFSPAISVDLIPDAIQRTIGAREQDELCQLKRGTSTSIRVNEANRFGEKLDLELFARIIAQQIRLEVKLIQKNKLLMFNGRMTDNWYLDGMLTDAENYTLVNSYEHPQYQGEKRFERSDGELITATSTRMFLGIAELLSKMDRKQFIEQTKSAVKQEFPNPSDFESTLIGYYFIRIEILESAME